ncbi:hypothetical protein BX616_011276 [Lobosporangium transversale]|nr:hypothetical protein BX616_011276 [Lobosporangium transversale]
MSQGHSSGQVNINDNDRFNGAHKAENNAEQQRNYPTSSKSYLMSPSSSINPEPSIQKGYHHNDSSRFATNYHHKAADIPPNCKVDNDDRKQESRNDTEPTAIQNIDSSQQQICMTRIIIPESHRDQFVKALSNSPDLALRIKKKSVRFNSLSKDLDSSSSSPAKMIRRDDCPVAYSKINKNDPPSSTPSSTPSNSSHISSTLKTSFRALYNSLPISSTVQSLPLPCAQDKDPDEKVAELMELKQMNQISQTAQDLEDKESLLDEVRSERKVLQTELARYIAMVKQIQKDFALAQQAEADLIKERDQLSQHLTQLKQHDFIILKEEVDQLRIKKGLQPLPSLEQEEAEYMGRYLEQRRGQWREDGVLHDSHAHSQNIFYNNINDGVGGSSSSDNFTGVNTNSGRNQNEASSSRSNSRSRSIAVSSQLSHPSASTSTGHSRRKEKERERERERDCDRDNSRGKDKDKDDRRSKTSNSNTSSIGSRRGRPSLSTPATAKESQKNQSKSQSQSRSQSPKSSSSFVSAREERSKKRSRY